MRRLDDQILITSKTELAFDTQKSLLNAKNQKIIIGQRKLVNTYQPSLDPDDVMSDDLNPLKNVNKEAYVTCSVEF